MYKQSEDELCCERRPWSAPINIMGLMVASQVKDGCLIPETMKSPE